MLRYALAAVAFSLSVPAFAAGIAPAELRAEPEVQPAMEDSAAPKAAKARKAPRVIPVTLDPPSSDELAPLAAPRRAGLPMQVGVGREVAALASESRMATHLQWEPLENGGRIAALSVTSPGAAALRIGLRIVKMPEEALLRFQAEGGGEVFEATGAEVNEAIARNEAAGETGPGARTWWSPVLESFSGVLEIELPAAVKPASLRFFVPHVSHFAQSPRSDMPTAKASASCHVDATCAASTWGLEIDAVARMTFVVGSGSYLCTGTLLADGDSSTSVPYFLTANHCISSQTSASSLVTYWFYRTATCNGAMGNTQTRSGGAALLRASAATDVSFLRLNSAPPAGAVYAGWIAAAPGTGTDVTGLHHPAGDLQKISRGDIAGYATCTTPDSQGRFSCSNASSSSATFYVVTWRSGVTEGGSSGSGLFRDSGRYLIGQLYGGSSSCADPTAGDLYGRFDVAYNSGLSQWLAPTSTEPPPPPPPSSYALSVTRSGLGTGLVASNPAGLDCGPTCSAMFAAGAAVTLQATPAAGSAFAGWGGACSGTSPTCTVTMNAAKSVFASFAPMFTLTVAKAGQGAGTIASNPAAIACGATCAADFVAGSTLTLVATPAVGSRFAGWSGASCTGTGSCVVTLTASRSVTATFEFLPPPPVATAASAPDFNADGVLDYTWRRTNGTHGIWLMNGHGQQTFGLLAAPAGATLQQLLDFDGDGRTDVLWRAPDGAWSISLMDGIVARSTTQILAGGTGWEAIAGGDLDGDGKADLLWRKGEALYGAWLMDGATVRSAASLAAPSPGYHVAAIADFDANGRADILWRHGDGTAQVHLMDGASVAASATIAAGASWLPAFVADFNGDGKSDLIWRHSSGLQGLWLMDGTAASSTVALYGPGAGWSTMLAADFDGDGKDDLLWRDAAGKVRIVLMDGAAEGAFADVAVGPAWTPVRARDISGDGKADLLWRSTDGAYASWLMDGVAATSYGMLLSGGTGWDVAP